MKRWEVTYLGKPFLLYGNTADEVREKYADTMDEGSDILPYSDTKYYHRVNYIKQGQCIKEQLRPNGYEQREIYKHDCFLGTIYVRIFKDVRDGEYYDFCQYQIHNPYSLIYPIIWTCGTTKEVYDLLNIGKVKYEVYSCRLYGQPKLSKPCELKSIKSIGSTVFIPKKCSCGIYIKENDIWINHNDYFSNSWKPPKSERTDMSQSYYLNKYFNKARHRKFVYDDNWGNIVLRNQAWIVIRNLLPLIEYPEIDDTQIAKMIIESQEYTEHCKLDTAWILFWENVIKLVKEKL